jgi:hypothetical protein
VQVEAQAQVWVRVRVRVLRMVFGAVMKMALKIISNGSDSNRNRRATKSNLTALPQKPPTNVLAVQTVARSLCGNPHCFATKNLTTTLAHS